MELILAIAGALFVVFLAYVYMLSRRSTQEAIAQMTDKKDAVSTESKPKAKKSKPAKRAVYHLVGIKGGWAIKEEGNSEPIITDRLKKNAFNKGRKLAKASGLGQLIVHGRDGKIQKEFTYGNDPRESKG